MRYFGHACVLLESRSTAVLVDPVPGYTDDGYDHFTLADLPTHLDAIVLSHAHPDHVNVEALLQLRHRTRTVVVPAGSGGDLADPDLAAMLGALGFRSVTRLDCLEEFAPGEDTTITALPFTGEHADLDIRTKMVPLVRIAGRAFAFATDTAPDVPDFYDRIAARLGPVDALFVGLECVGAPLSWLYGPLLESLPARHHDQARRLRGSDAAMADRLARQFGARRAYAYAMGFEPWLKHFTGSVYDGDSPQLSQTRAFIARCDARGIPAELLDGRHERSWGAAE
jgi:L-ascorbate metabolism protein UlaG (beta-lactamase superfamily)